MDLEEWEILSNEDSTSPKFIVKNNNNNNNNDNNNIINMDYFQEISDQEKKSDDQEIKSKDLFNNSLENQFVDMKMDSPKSLNRVILPEFDQKEVKDCNFEVKKLEEDEKMVVYEEKKVNIEEELSEKMLNSCMSRDGVEKEKEEGENEGVNIWKWAKSGMGALVTFGFTAVTISLVVFSNQHNNNSKDKKDLHFQIYSHDKRFKQVVRRAKRLNEAISVMRGAPITTAHITIGGYHEGL